MADLARLAGVSISTVSRAITGSGFASPEIRSKIAEAVRETGYVVNEAARGLRLQKVGHVLVLVPRINKPFFSSVLLGVEEALQEGGYGMLVGNAGIDPKREASLAQALLTGAADGIILLTGRMPSSLVRSPRAERRLVAASEPIAGIPSVTVANDEASATATRHLIELGHRRIAHIGGHPSTWLSKSRLSGFSGAMRAAGLPVPKNFIWLDDFTMAAGEAAIRRLLALEQRPTAVVCGSDEIAIGAMRGAYNLGLDTPRDISIVGFDDIEVAYALRPALTTISQPRHLMGRKSAEMLLALLMGEEEVTDQVLPTELILRESAGHCSEGQA